MELFERERELAAIDRLLEDGGVLVVEGGAGIGKTSLLDEAASRAAERGFEVLRARGSELEAVFPFGVARRLFERRLAGAAERERDELLAGPAAPARSLLLGAGGELRAGDSSFAVLHGLYWLAVNLAGASSPLALVVDDVQWADEPSLRFLAYLAARIEGTHIALVGALRPHERTASEPALAALVVEATVVRPELLSVTAVAAVAHAAIGAEADDELCALVARASGGNPLYVQELLRGVARKGRVDAEGLVESVAARVRRLDVQALELAQALAVLGDGSELRHGAAMVDLDLDAALRLADGLVQVDVLETVAPVGFLHPIVRAAVEASLGHGARDRHHRAAARLLHEDSDSPGRVAAHLVRVLPAGDTWVVGRLREAAADAVESGAPRAAAELLERALAEPPAPSDRLAVLREAARAEAGRGSEVAVTLLEQALALAADGRQRAEVALEVAEVCASLFRWVDAVDVLERALAELGEAEPALAARLEGELVVSGLHDARRARHVPAALERLARREVTGAPAEALAVARGMAAVLTGEPADEAGRALAAVLTGSAPRAENWDTRAALLWSLVIAERFEELESALGPMRAEVDRSGSARGLIAVYSTLGLLNLRLGALPEADAAGRVALRVLQEADFAPGLAFAATVLADVAVEAGELDEAEALLELLPQEGWPPGVGTVLIPAARARLRLAQGHAAEALADFNACREMFAADGWGMELRDVGYVHARSGAALALLRLGDAGGARALAQAELDDARVFGAPAALGIALRVAGLAEGGTRGLELLGESDDVLRDSPAVLERARSAAELGAALRRAGERAASREPLAEALDLAVRCGARPLVARVREELRAAGARPRRELRRGVDSLTPSELRVARLAAGGRTNREIAHELYVTLKTVEGHLARVYRKLGIDGRSELATALAPEKTRVGTL